MTHTERLCLYQLSQNMALQKYDYDRTFYHIYHVTCEHMFKHDYGIIYC